MDNENYLKMLKSLYELKNFSDEILVFPSKDALIENLLFAKTLDPGNPVINLKIELAR